MNLLQVASVSSSVQASDFISIGSAIPVRPLTTEDRSAENARVLEYNRGTLDWEAKMTTAEVAMSSLGGRAFVLGEDRWGMSYFVLGAHDSCVWVRGRLDTMSSEPRLASGGGTDPTSKSKPLGLTGAGGTTGVVPPKVPVPPAVVNASMGYMRGGNIVRNVGAVSMSVANRSIAESAVRRVPALAMLQPGEWAVYDSPESLAALIRVLHPLGRTEGPLRQALLRREPLLLTAMAALSVNANMGLNQQPEVVQPKITSTEIVVTPVLDGTAPAMLDNDIKLENSSGVEKLSSCAFCAQPVVSLSFASSTAICEPPQIRTLHCFVCHMSFPVGSALREAARALFVSHVRSCWAASACIPVRRAVAVACATAAAAPPAQQRNLSANNITGPMLRAAVDSSGASFADVASALDPVLLQLKRQAICLAEAVDWSRLRFPAVWPPSSRSEWGRAVLSAYDGGELNRLLHVLARVLQADDTAAGHAAIATAPAVSRDGARKRTQAEIAVLVAEATTPDVTANPGSLKWRWVPQWFLDQTPNPEAAVGVRTAAAAAWTLRSLGAVLRPNLIPRAAPTAL
jgi:hypothetical protein